MKLMTWTATIAIIVIPIEGALLATNWRNQSCPIGEAVRMPIPFEHNEGRAWYAEVPELERLADDKLDAYKSPVVICENDRVLGPAHAYHKDITKEGRGRFSHWGTGLVFSTSDNSNPNTNGRSYLAISTKSDTAVSEPAVRPASESPAKPAQAQLAALTPLQVVTGKVVKLDKAGQQISLQRGEPGQGGEAIEQFVLTNESAYDLLKTGDRVALTIELDNGVRTVTRYSRLQ